MDPQQPKANIGTCHVKSNDIWSVTQLIKLHYCIYSGYKLRTFLLGYAYEDDSKTRNDDDAGMMQRMQLSLLELR